MWAAETYRLPSSFLTRVLWRESGFRTVCENGSTEDHPTVLPTTARTEALPAPAAPRARVEELVETVLAHPLFSATRRPPEQAKTDRSADPGLGNLRL
jgi:hypothetical protein